MDATFRECEPYYGSSSSTGIALSPPEVGQERENENERSQYPVLVPTSGGVQGSLTLDTNDTSNDNISIQGEESHGDSSHEDNEDAIADSSVPSQRAESTMHEDPGDDTKEIGDLKHYLAKEFEVKDLGHLRYFLGIEVSRASKDSVGCTLLRSETLSR